VTQASAPRFESSKRERLAEIEKMIVNVMKESKLCLSEDQLRRGLGTKIRKTDFDRVLKNLKNNKKMIFHRGSIFYRDMNATTVK
jgi:hypothetical protein